ncbi:MAG: hypothetical protein KAS32_02460 [Candidatus Peribacteraceae bacterium]|nr:hypothetical protein [Candidatus Peribacteraceae bacterium]
MPLIFDTEASGFLFSVTKLHCIVVIDTDTKITETYYDAKYPSDIHWVGKIAHGLKRLKSYQNDGGIIVGHNIAGYDLPVIKKLTGCNLSLDNCYDTFISSCLLFPDKEGGHSLEQWAVDLKLSTSKVVNEDWSKLTVNMLDRCIADVKINLAVYDHLKSKENTPDFASVVSMETKVSNIQAYQELHGVHYDIMKASETIIRFDKKIKQLSEEITKGVPSKLSVYGVTKKFSEFITGPENAIPYYDNVGTKPYKKHGGLKANVVKYLGENIAVQGKVGPFSRVTFTPLNLNSHPQVKEYLLSIGWKPREWNFKMNPLTLRKERTSPKLTEESYASLPPGLGQKIAELYVLKHRRRSILNEKDVSKGALATVRPEDGRVPAEALTCATPTSRHRHMRTVCNIPRPTSMYGKEIRELFCVPKGRWMLGVDLSGIEARMMCHYVLVVAEASGDPAKIKAAEAMVDLVINRPKSEDFHTANSLMWGVDRDTAKTAFYALLFGCGEAKLASTLGKSKGEGKKLMAIFWDTNEPLKDVISALESSYCQNGHIRGLDGRIICIRDKRKLLNSLLQGGAAVVFKRWLIDCDSYFQTHRGLSTDIHRIAQVHDEIQTESYSPAKEIAKQHGIHICTLAVLAGEFYNLQVPTPAAYSIGSNWSETH